MEINIVQLSLRSVAIFMLMINVQSSFAESVSAQFEPMWAVVRPSEVNSTFGKSNSAETAAFISKISSINENLHDFLDANITSLENSYKESGNKKTVFIIGEIIRYVKDAQAKVQSLRTNSRTYQLQKDMLVYYDQFVKYYNALLKGITKRDLYKKDEVINPSGDSISQELRVAMKDLIVWENKFNDSLQGGLTRDQDNKTFEGLSAEEVSRMGLSELQKVYAGLVLKTQELIKANESLKIEAERLVRHNVMLQEQLMASLERSIAYMTVKQRKEFLHYLKSL